MLRRGLSRKCSGGGSGGIKDGLAWGYVLAESWLPRKRSWLYWWTGPGGKGEVKYREKVR